MFRNYLITALRNLARNWLYGAISILGLAVAFTAALLIAQFVRNEFSYDNWIPGYQQVYKIGNTIVQPNQPASPSDISQSILASQIRAVAPGVLAVRLMQDLPPVKHRQADTAAADRAFAWADEGSGGTATQCAGDQRSPLSWWKTPVGSSRFNPGTNLGNPARRCGPRSSPARTGCMNELPSNPWRGGRHFLSVRHCIGQSFAWHRRDRSRRRQRSAGSPKKESHHLPVDPKAPIGSSDNCHGIRSCDQ